MHLILGVKCDVMLVLRSQFLEHLRETCTKYKHSLEHVQVARSDLFSLFFLPIYGKRLTIIHLYNA